MLCKLVENPNAKFRNLRFGGIAGLKNGDFVWLDKAQHIGDSVTIHYNPGKEANGNLLDDWELVPETVDFMTAINALKVGKTIKCKQDMMENRVYKNSSFIKDQHNEPISVDEIIYGKWYIEN